MAVLEYKFMKNITVFLSVLAVFGMLSFGMSGTAHAATTLCGDPAQSTLSVTYTQCGNGNPADVIGGWGTNNAGVPAMTLGQTATDDGGITDTCTVPSGCVDIFHTPWYISSMVSLGRQLKALGMTGGRFGYWINLAK